MTAETPSLTLTYPAGPLAVSVSFDRWDGDRAQFRYLLTSDDVSVMGDDLRMGSGSDPSLAEAMASLLDFVSAFAEAIEYESRTGIRSDNRSLFPDSLADVCEGIGSETLYLLARDVCGSDDEEN